MYKLWWQRLATLMVLGLVLLSGCGLARRTAATQTQAAVTPLVPIASTATALSQPTDTAAPAQATVPAATATFEVTRLAETSATPMPTSTPVATVTRTAARPAQGTLQAASAARPAKVNPAGAMQIDNWSLAFTGAASEPGKNPALLQPDPTMQTLVVFLDVTNVDSRAGTFTAFSKIQIMDEQGHVFADDNQADAAAQQKYGTDFGSSIAPGATQRVAGAYEVPAAEKQFKIIQANPAGPWTGTIVFRLP